MYLSLPLVGPPEGAVPSSPWQLVVPVSLIGLADAVEPLVVPAG